MAVALDKLLKWIGCDMMSCSVRSSGICERGNVNDIIFGSFGVYLRILIVFLALILKLT